MSKIAENSIWFVKHPTYIYEEDVAKLARQNDLKIIDEKFKSKFKPEFATKKAPKLTIKKEFLKEEAK